MGKFASTVTASHFNSISTMLSNLQELDKSDANGIILQYELKIKQKNSSKINTTDREYSIIISQLGCEISLIASNSVGSSPEGTLIVPNTWETGKLCFMKLVSCEHWPALL